LNLAEVPHYELETPPLPQPDTPPRYIYTQNKIISKTDDDKNENAKSLWEKITGDAVAFATLCLVAANVVLAISTVGLWIVTARSGNRQTRDMQASIKIAERALTDYERPWLFLEGAKVTRRDSHKWQPAPGGDVLESAPPIPNDWYISLQWRNIGRTPALVQDCIFKIQDKESLPATPDYTGSGPPLSCQRTVAADERFSTGEVGPAPGRTNLLVFFGRMTYEELNGRVHHTGFALEVAPMMPVFGPYISNAYDYYD
jgi:hypothetical protein